jgi:hypothetical protein
MEVHLPHNQEALLNDLAAHTGRATDDLVQEAVAQLLAQTAPRPRQPAIGEVPSEPSARKSRLWELRKGLALGDLSIKELIEEGRE